MCEIIVSVVAKHIAHSIGKRMLGHRLFGAANNTVLSWSVPNRVVFGLPAL